MPVSRSHLTRPKPRQVLVDLGEGDALSIVFDANRITPAWMREAQERDEATDPLSLPTALSEIILRWDVTEEDGSEFAPTAANLAEFSYPVQSQLLTEILKAAVPSSEEGNGSSDTSAMASTDSVSSAGDPPEWASSFPLGEALGIPAAEVEDYPVEWVVRAQMWLEAQESARRASEARSN